MKILNKIAQNLNIRFATCSPNDYVRSIIQKNPVSLALDVGCGDTSLLTQFRPHLQSAGLDVFTIETALKGGAHDHYISANIVTTSVEDIMEQLQARFGRPRADLVTLFGVVEHLTRRDGFQVLDKLEQLSDRFVLIDTPNGFVPQGPEYGNPYQRHLSGWFPKDFEALGYDVHGSLGTKYLRGYMGEPRLGIPGTRLFDNVILSRLLMTKRFPQHSFNIVAIKDKHGVPARYSAYNDLRRI